MLQAAQLKRFYCFVLTLAEMGVDALALNQGCWNNQPRVLKQSTNHSHTGDSNRILSKVQKSFWSCTHVNSC